jgi:hypothetical protein
MFTVMTHNFTFIRATSLHIERGSPLKLCGTFGLLMASWPNCLRAPCRHDKRAFGSFDSTGASIDVEPIGGAGSCRVRY